MGKADIFKDHLSLQVLGSVATPLQAIPIVNLVMRFVDTFSDHKIGDSELKIDPLPFDVVQEAWISVATETGNLVMGGCFPGLYILLHVVAETTKGGTLRICKNPYEEDDEKQGKKAVDRLLSISWEKMHNFT